MVNGGTSDESGYLSAAGMIGRKLFARLARDGRLAGSAIDRVRLVDMSRSKQGAFDGNWKTCPPSAPW